MALSKPNDKQMDPEEFRTEIEHMPRDLGMFSLSMRSLYAGKAVGTNSEAAAKFRKLRDATRNDAMVYLKDVLPVCVKFVASISEWFEYYEELDYEEWCDNLEDILEETTGYKQLCETIVEMHKDILVSLKERQDEARLVVQELTELQEEFERKKEELEKSARGKSVLAAGLFFVPYVNVIATPLLCGMAQLDTAQAIAHGAQAKIQEAAALTVRETLIPALESFINGLQKAAGFFQVMEVELGKFQGKAEKGKESKKKIHYRMMKAEATKMDAACKKFYSIIPVVETDLKAIPTKGTDQNYVDKWLQKQIKKIEEKGSFGEMGRRLIQAITGGPTSEGKSEARSGAEYSGAKSGAKLGAKSGAKSDQDK